MKMIFVLGCLLALGSVAVVGAPIGPVCGTCQGGVYNLTFNTVSMGEVDIFNLFLIIDTTLYTGGGSYIHAVAPKVSNLLTAFTLLSAPGGTSGWETFDGGLHADGCSGAGAGFLCTQSTGLGAPLTNPINQWGWRITLPHDSLFTGAGQASIKVLFVDGEGNKVGDLVSESTTLSQIPEPIPLLLLGSGLVGLGLFSRRRRRVV